ncbi:MAG TPA: class I SAM-dependent methyltransferase [Longimicrobiales bacterium]|nr:class I SAM-dependent methyltransferase [Longimicrobiales bacterium]
MSSEPAATRRPEHRARRPSGHARSAPTPHDVARHYDELDAFYRELWGEHVHHGIFERADDSPEVATERLVELVARRARLGPGDRVCDVGCGYGATARMIAATHGCVVVGLTVSAEQHRRAVAAAPASCTFLLRDWLRNDLDDAGFDAVIAIESTAHMADKAGAIAEAARVLRPGGRLVVCAWLAGDDVGGWRTAWLLDPICRWGRLPGLGTEADYRGWIAAAGLRLEGFEDLSRSVRRTWSVVARRAAAAVATRARYRRYLFRGPERGFAPTIALLWLAYRTGAFRYGVFTAARPSD